VYKKVFSGDISDMDMKKFDQTDKVIEFLKDVPSNKRKTILSALVIITDDKKYRDLMMSDIKVYDDDTSKQEKTEGQKENWVDVDAVKAVVEKLRKDAELLYKKETLTMNDLQQIQNYVIICLASGLYTPPRRSKDLVDWKIRNIDKEKDNYLDKWAIHYNSYKTAKTYGEQVVNIPTVLKGILNKWIKINPTEWLIFDNNKNPLTAVKLNQRLNKLFGKKVSINLLRHSFLTDKYGDTIKLNKDIANTMQAMGSSSNMLNTYVKNED
jgi:integrase